MRVLDLSRLLPGPYCTRLLADLGFEVIKVERPGEGDWVRYVPPVENGESTLFKALNRGKKSLTLDLKSERGQAIFLKFIERSDVLLESFRPDVMANWGLAYERLAQTNPRLIYCSLTGFGQQGEYRAQPGHDLNYIGLCGLLDLTGQKDGPPVIPGAQIADLAGGLWVVIGILHALLERERTRRGQRVDGSLLGAALSFLPVAAARQAGGETMARGASDLTGGIVCYHVYATQDGKYMTLAALEPKFWISFCQAVGQQDLLEAQFAPAVPGEEVYETLRALFKSRTRQEWVEVLSGAEACCEPVYSFEEALVSPPIQALGMLADGVLYPPLCIGEHQFANAAPAPGLGEHNTALLGELGYSEVEVLELKAAGVI